jgi:hypothetical protein
MKFNDKKNEKQNELEMDELNIKSHLNTSLDLSGINVSEDLINRTLAAIKAQPAENKEQQVDSNVTSKKVIPWNRYVRGFAGVAAAVLIVAVGFNVIKQVPFGGQKGDSSNLSSEQKIAYDGATVKSTDADTNSSNTQEAATSDNTFASSAAVDTTESAASETTAPEASVQYTITAEDTAKSKDISAGEAASENSAGSSDADLEVADEAQPKLSMALRNNDGTNILTFREIFLPDPEQAQYLTIKDEVNNTSVSLTDQTAIQDFYSVMDKYTFTYGTENTSNQNYTVEVKSPEPESLYTLIVGQNLIVRYTEGDTVSEVIYNVEDPDVFKQNLDEFYQKYSE